MANGLTRHLGEGVGERWARGTLPQDLSFPTGSIVFIMTQQAIAIIVDKYSYLLLSLLLLLLLLILIPLLLYYYDYY